MSTSTKQLKVAAAAVVVKVNGDERYLYRGAVLPAGVAQADITRLRNSGLLREVEVEASAPKAAAKAEPATEKPATPGGAAAK